MNPLEMNADWMDDRLEAYLDDALPADERRAFVQRLRDEDWDDELLLARQVRDGLRALPQPRCPMPVTQAVLAEVRQRRRASRAARLQAWLEAQLRSFWQPALAMSVLVLVVASAVLFGRPPQHTHSAEVEQALAEVRWTLAYLTEVGRETGHAVRDDVIEKRVVSPMQQALGFTSPRPRANDGTHND